MLVVANKYLQEMGSRRMFVAFSTIVLLLLVFISLGPAKGRIQGTWQVLTDTVEQGEMTPSKENSISSAVARLEWWKMSFQMWLVKPIAGYGTVIFPKAATDWKASHVEDRSYDVSLVHPHNQYLFSMVRWGVIGLASLLLLLYYWTQAGILRPWGDSVAVPLIALTGISLFVHGLSNASMEEHFSTIFAVLMLAAGLADTCREKK